MVSDYMTLINGVDDEVSEAPVYITESLTREPDEVNRLLGYRSDGELQIGDPTSTGFWRPGPSHANRRGSAIDAFDAMPGWQRAAFRELLSLAVKDVYEGLAYDFDFLR